MDTVSLKALSCNGEFAEEARAGRTDRHRREETAPPTGGPAEGVGPWPVPTPTPRLRACGAEPMADLRARVETLGAAATTQVVAQGVPASAVTRFASAHLRYRGTDTALEVPLTDAQAMARAFSDQHRQRFGFTMTGTALVVEAVAVEAVASF